MYNNCTPKLRFGEGETTVSPDNLITIPRRIRQALGVRNGNEFELIVQNQALVLKPKEPRIEAALVLYKATHTVSLEKMEKCC